MAIYYIYGDDHNYAVITWPIKFRAWRSLFNFLNLFALNFDETQVYNKG